MVFLLTLGTTCIHIRSISESTLPVTYYYIHLCNAYDVIVFRVVLVRFLNYESTRTVVVILLVHTYTQYTGSHIINTRHYLVFKSYANTVAESGTARVCCFRRFGHYIIIIMCDDGVHR